MRQGVASPRRQSLGGLEPRLALPVSRALRLAKSRHPVKPLFEGDWA